jgi:23S rRNA (cytosine1962-C5)-methyltransferase
MEHPMQIQDDYELLDSGNGQKLERFGAVILARPCAQAVWEPSRPELWESASATFDRKDGLNWRGRERLPEEWVVSVRGVRMRLSTTDFGHLGIFPETLDLWEWIAGTVRRESEERGEAPHFLNLFAYSGGATLAAALAGAQCCHLDASRGMVEWARANAALNDLQDAGTRFIVDDVSAFLRREVRRGRKYDCVLLDPPSFGRGKRGELYKVEKNVQETLDLVRQVLSDTPLFVILTSHTPGFSPIVLRNLLEQTFGTGTLACGEMLLHGAEGVLDLPSGTWGRWEAR